MNIVRNSATCTNCNDNLQSFLKDDFITCSCKKVSIAGGLHFLHRTGEYLFCKETSIFSSKYKDDCCDDKYIIWASDIKIKIPTLFFTYEDAEKIAKKMTNQFGGNYYVLKLTKPVI